MQVDQGCLTFAKCQSKNTIQCLPGCGCKHTKRCENYTLCAHLQWYKSCSWSESPCSQQQWPNKATLENIDLSRHKPAQLDLLQHVQRAPAKSTGPVDLAGGQSKTHHGADRLQVKATPQQHAAACSVSTAILREETTLKRIANNSEDMCVIWKNKCLLRSRGPLGCPPE